MCEEKHTVKELKINDKYRNIEWGEIEIVSEGGMIVHWELRFESRDIGMKEITDWTRDDRLPESKLFEIKLEDGSLYSGRGSLDKYDNHEHEVSGDSLKRIN